jgi:hypothetical protein
MFALIENGTVKKYPYSLYEIQRANLNTSFPSTVSDETMAEYGAMRVYYATQPVLSDTQVLEEDPPVFSNEDQRWTQVWRVREMTAEEVTQRFDSAASAVRQQRNEKLKDSDWTQITDATADKAAWATYRQALRDVTAQAGFPWTITWPDAP